MTCTSGCSWSRTSQMLGRLPGWSSAMTTKCGMVFFTLSEICDSSADFTNNFYVGLICKRCQYNFSHEAGMVRHEDPNRFFHGTLRALEVSMFRPHEVSIKKHPHGSTGSSDSLRVRNFRYAPIMTYTEYRAFVAAPWTGWHDATPPRKIPALEFRFGKVLAAVPGAY